MSERRTSLIFCILFSIIVAGMALYEIINSYTEAENKAKERVASKSFLIGEWLKGAFVASDYILQDIIYTIPVSELTYPAEDQEEHARITKYIIDKQNSLPHANGVGLSNSDGIVTHTPSIVGFDANHREWHLEQKNNPDIETYVSNMFTSNNGELMVIQNRKFPGNQFSGLAGIGVNLNFFSTWLDQVTIGEKGVIAICDQNISLLARKPNKPEMMGKQIEDPVVSSFIKSGERYKILKMASPVDQEKRIYGVRKVNNLPFIVVVGEADREWQKDWIENSWMIVGGVLFLWLMAFFSLYVHWSRLSNLAQLKEALKDVKKLSGLLPICAHCKKIRDDKGYWKQIETYIHEHSEAEFSHGICQDCAEELYGDEKWFKDMSD